MAKKAKRKINTDGWLATFSDMVTLLLVFFVLLVGEPTTSQSKIQLVLASFGGLGPLTGGMTLSPGKLAQLGATIEALPAEKRARGLDVAYDRAFSLLNAESMSMLNIQNTPERGLIITLMGDAFFEPGSAEVNIDETRNMLDKIATLFNSSSLANAHYRIEGYTDSVENNPEFYSLWELSAARAANVLHYLVDFGADPSRFQIAGFADTRPVSQEASRNLAENRAVDRRVEIVVLADGHL